MPKKGFTPHRLRRFLKAGNGPYALRHLGTVNASAGRTNQEQVLVSADAKLIELTITSTHQPLL